MKQVMSALIWCVAIGLTIIITQYTMCRGVKEELSEIKTELKYMQYRDSMYAIYEMIPKSTRTVIHAAIQSESYVDAVHQYLKHKKNYDKRVSLRELLDENR